MMYTVHAIQHTIHTSNTIRTIMIHIIHTIHTIHTSNTIHTIHTIHTVQHTIHTDTSYINLDAPQTCRETLANTGLLGTVGCDFMSTNGGMGMSFTLTFYSWPLQPRENNLFYHRYCGIMILRYCGIVVLW
jgi:hypothetical protein